MKIYFASDQHLGAPTYEASRKREDFFVQWLEAISKDATHLFLLGDLFDFWFEYKKVVPKGFTRTLGTLARMSDRGIKIYFFAGNHDLWVKDYLIEECGMEVFHKPQTFEFAGKRFYIGHGDGLGPGDKGYKRMKKVFTNPFAKWLFSWFHPDLGVRLAQYLSVENRMISGDEDVKFLGQENEWLVIYAEEILKKQHVDYFLFGHRHLPMELKLSNGAIYLNTGDWISYFTYAVFDGKKLQARVYEPAVQALS